MSSRVHIAAIVLLIFNLYSFSRASTKFQRNDASPSFSVDYPNNQFLLDGHPFRYISGSIHYFRIHPSQWKDRLQRVRALGFNAIQYYIPWNYHEIYEGEYNFNGKRNFSRFAEIAYELGMYSLVRLGPYVCGEWENGGLPWWLLNKNISTMRSSEKRFKSAVETWFSVLLPFIKPLLRQNNGPVLMVQIENEFGSYNCDRSYTMWLRDLTWKYLGNDTVIYTTDGDSEGLLKCGAVPGTLTTVDFGPSTEATINASFTTLKKFLPHGHGPLVNSEFYPGWLVLWGEKTASIPATRNIVKSAQYMYSLGASINFYMIHGGTNFGFWNGAETTAPVITSYDYFAPISEAGDITEKYLAIRTWIKGIPGWKTQPLDVPKDNPKAKFGVVEVRPMNDLSQIPEEVSCVFSQSPMSFEQLGQPFGFVLYATKMVTCGKRLQVKQLKDFGYVYLQRKYLGTLVHSYYGKTKNYVDLNGCIPGDTLVILVENQGRQTYETINDFKGILSDVEMDEIVLNGWIQCKMNIANDYANTISSSMQSAGSHGLYEGAFDVDVPMDTFLNTTGWGKGVVVVNGKNLGRYWASEGPQYTLYVPSAFLRPGRNSLTILELESTHNCLNGSCYMSFVDHPIYALNVTTSNGDFQAGPKRYIHKRM